MFWGIHFYNDMLLQQGDQGNVQSEILLHKDPGLFTFREGWAFPRRIYFNGDDCVMPPPDQYPRLPNVGSTHKSSHSVIVLSFLLLLVMFWNNDQIRVQSTTCTRLQTTEFIPTEFYFEIVFRFPTHNVSHIEQEEQTWISLRMHYKQNGPWNSLRDLCIRLDPPRWILEIEKNGTYKFSKS